MIEGIRWYQEPAQQCRVAGCAWMFYAWAGRHRVGPKEVP